MTEEDSGHEDESSRLQGSVNSDERNRNSAIELEQYLECTESELSSRNGGGKRKRSAMACARCRHRHIKCPGGQPCGNCLKVGIACEYLEPNKKLIVSMNYLQKLQSDLSRMKKENVKLQTKVSENEQQLNILKALKKRLKSENLISNESMLLANGSRMLSRNEHGDVDTTFQRNSVQDNKNDYEIVPNFSTRTGRLVASRTGQEYFVGPSSMTLFGMEIFSLIPDSLKKERKEIAIKQNLNETDNLKGSQFNAAAAAPTEAVDEVLKEEGNAYKIILAKQDGDNDISVNFTLPSYSYAVLLVDIFITYNDGCFYFFNEGVVKNNLKLTYDGVSCFDDHTLQTIWFCKALLIFAIGEMYLGTSNKISGNKLSSKDSPRLPGSGFFEQASELFSCLFSSGRIENITKEGGIEVMLLYAFYLQVADCTVASYFYFGQALRACLILGWHVDAQKDHLTRFELEHRRRIWWTVYMFERMLSSKAGLPLSFTDNTIAAELPDDFDMSAPPPGCENYIFPEAEYITNCVRITQINAKILNKLYQKQPDSNILPVLKEIVTQLLEWRSNLSSFLQVDFTQQDLKISRLCTNMFTEYFQGMNLAIRPLLFHFASIQLQQFEKTNTYINLKNYSKTISSLLNCSLQSSINTIRSLWALMDQNMVALFGYMDREYIFTSASTLVLFNAAFGIHDQTLQHLDHALKIFTKMRNLGNNPASLRRAQLLRLMSMLDFNDKFKDLMARHTDALRPNFQFDIHNDRNVDIVSHVSTTSPFPYYPNSSKSQNNSITHTESSERLSDETAIKCNTTRLDSLNIEQNLDIEKLLENLDNVGKSDDKLWKEISDQAMWLGPTVDPASSVLESNIIGDFEIEDFM